MIERYSLPNYCSYTSGDGIFRSDGTLGRTYHFFRFSSNFNFNKKSICWKLTEQDKKMLLNDFNSLIFPTKGNIVYYIKFYGKGNKIRTRRIRNDIRKYICKQHCVNCGTTTNIECDHKNDLALEQNDTRVLDIKTQTIYDFQPLCKHCNCVKRNVKKKMMKTGKRQGPPLDSLHHL